MKATLRLSFSAILLLLISMSVQQFSVAQGAATGDLHVTVKDPKGSAVANATVTVSDVAKGVERTATSDGQGGYSARQLPPATYSVTVDSTGFAKTEATGVSITVGELAELPVTLSVAGGKEVVEVSAQAEIIETSRSSSTDTIGERRIDNLPINGRNYIQFTLTDSQVQRDNAPNVGAAPTSGLNMSGQRGRSNLVNVDGADATDNSTNGVRSTVSQEAVQEFQIITNSYAAEYGRASGGVVNIITRSGSNDFHGDVFGYLRNRNFQAVNPFSTTANPAYTRVQGGAAFGGPIKKDKTYYYFAYEITRRHETGFSSIGNDGYGLVNTDVSTAFGFPQGSGLVIQATPDQAAFLGPTPSPALAGYALTVGAGSGIAVNGTYPAFYGALIQAGFIPAPTNGSNPLAQFFSSCSYNPDPTLTNTLCNGLPASFHSLQSQAGNFPVFEGTSLYSLRLDHNLTANNRLTFRANVSPSTVTGIEVNGQDQPFGQNSYSRTSQQTYRDVAGVFQDTWTIGNNKVNSFTFQYARRGLSYFYNQNDPAGSDPAVNIIGEAYIGREPYSFIQRVENRYQFTDNFSWTLGRHNTKFGVDFNYLPITATFTVNYGGVYNFSPLTGLFPPGVPDLSSVQAYGLGIPSYIVQGIGSPKDSFNNKPLGLFWQDSWRVRNNLTLNLGLRYDIEFAPQFSSPDALALAGYDILGLQKGIQTDKNNIQPRIGIAWDPKGDGKTVIRSSYGIFYDHPLLGLYFLGDASDGSKTGQLLFFGASPCDGTSPSPLNLNASNIFQGILGVPGCLPPGLSTALGYQANTAAGAPCGAGPNPQRFDPCLPNSPFLNQQYMTGANPFPLISQPFGYPQGKGFVYAYSQQINFAVERDLGHGFALNLAYNFNGGHHLNHPINANAPRGDLLTANWQAAIAANQATPNTSPLDILSCGANPIPGAKLPYFVPSALTSFFRPGGLNPSLAAVFPPCVPLAIADLQAAGLNAACDPTTTGLAGCVPFSDMDANYSNGNSAYHGLTANLRKRFSSHYEFLASYTWSHAIDDSTDLQATLTPQDSYYPNLDRSNSTFDQRHRFVFSGVYQTGKLGGSGFRSKFFSDWTFSPLIEFSSGRPFNIVTGSGDNFQFSSETGRPNIVAAGTPTNSCGYPTVPSKFSPSGFLQEVCFADISPAQLLQPNALLLLDGNLGRNAGLTPWTVFDDVRLAKRVFFGERFNMDLIADMFNIANVYNVAAVSPLLTNAGQATAAYDPRQFQFALKLNW
jgi:Carboxypeptidase regulatory-like domain/TonB dependent receptor